MTKQIKVGDVVEVVETTGHSAELGSIGVVVEVFEDSSFWIEVYEEGWGKVYSQTLISSNVKLLAREGELKKVTGNNLPEHYLPIGTTVKVIGVCSSMSYEHFEEEGMAVKVKSPASEGFLVQYVNVYDLSEVDTVKEDPLGYLDEDTLILYTDEHGNISLATFVGTEEDGMFSVDSQPDDMFDGLAVIPDHRFVDSLGFSIGDTVMFVGEPSFYHQLEEGDVMPVVGIDTDGDLILDTSKLEHVTQSEQYLYAEQCLDLSLVDKTSLDDGSLSEFKVGDTVRIADTSCMSPVVKVGDTAEVERRGHSLVIRMTNGDVEGRQQYVDDYQLELVEESPKKVLFKKGTQFRNEEDEEEVYGLYKDFKEGDTVALLAQYDTYSFDTDIAEIIEVTDLGSEECAFQPYGNAFSDVEKVIVTESFTAGRRVFEKGDIYTVEVLTADDEGVFTETVIILPSGGRFTIQGVRDYSEFFAEYTGEEREEVKEFEGLRPFQVGDTVRIKDDSIFHQEVSVGDIGVVDGVSESIVGFKVTEGDGVGQHQVVVRGNERHHKYLELVEEVVLAEASTLSESSSEDKVSTSKKTDFKKGDVVKVTDSHYYSQSVSVGDVAKVDGVDSDGDLILKFIGEGNLDGLIQYTDGEDIELLVRTTEVKSKFEVGDIVSIKDDSIFNDKVSEGDKAVIIGDEYVLLMLTGKCKEQQQVCFSHNEDYANKFLELVRN